MADTQQLAAKLSDALNTAARCSSSDDAESYRRLAEKLAELEAAAGQFLRSHMAYQAVVSKLQQDAPLTADDLKTLRALIVGDADDYLKYDDDFGQAKGELGDTEAAIVGAEPRSIDAAARAVPRGCERAGAESALFGAKGTSQKLRRARATAVGWRCASHAGAGHSGSRQFM